MFGTTGLSFVRGAFLLELTIEPPLKGLRELGPLLSMLPESLPFLVSGSLHITGTRNQKTLLLQVLVSKYTSTWLVLHDYS
jgi:hypothetical protein